MSKTAAEASQILGGMKIGDGYRCPCPVCMNATLKLWDDPSGLSFECKKCDHAKVRAAMVRLYVVESDTQEEKPKEKFKWWQDGILAGEWIYRDVDPSGNVFETLKVSCYDMPDETQQFPCSRPPYGFNDKGDKGWKPVLLDLPELQEAIKANCSIFLAENEASARRLQQEGFTATAMKGGKWKAEYKKQLAGAKQIILLAGKDAKRQKLMDQVARSLKVSVSWVKFIVFPEHKDSRDWLESGFTRDELVAKVEAEPYYTPDAEEETKTEDPKPNVFTEYATAERFAEDYKDILIWSAGSWWIWTGKKWKEDNEGKALILVAESVRKWYTKFSSDPNVSRLELKIWHKSLESLSGLTHVLKIAERHLVKDFEIFDKDPLLLNLANGTYSFHERKLLEHNREHYCSKIIEIDYQESVKCDYFMKGLVETFAGNMKLVEFIIRAFGYSLTGLTQEQVFFFCYGPAGGNGKSTLLELIQRIMGEYARGMSKNLILEGGQEKKTGNPWRIAGRRYVLLDEIDASAKVDENALKSVTGEDTMNASKMFKDAFEFESCSKLWMRGNEKPRVRATDSVFRRVVLIPFMVKMGKVDRIKSLLWAEKEGILRLLIEGANDYLDNGLRIPAEIDEATNEYRQEMDVFKDFLEECCDLEDEHICPKENSFKYCTRADLFKALTAWQKECGHSRNWDIQRMQREMKQRGYVLKQKDGYHTYRGLLLKDEWKPAERSSRRYA